MNKIPKLFNCFGNWFNNRLFLYFSAILICSIFTSGLCINRGPADQTAILKNDLEEVIKGGIGDNNWWYANSLNEVRTILSHYYTGALLDQISQDCWVFIQQSTDWYCQDSLTDIEIIHQDKSQAEVIAFIKDYNLLTGESRAGEARYILIKTEQGWRICSAQYNWPQDSEGELSR
jgi:hypothetical protein